MPAPPPASAPAVSGEITGRPSSVPAEHPWQVLPSSIRLSHVYSNARLIITPMGSPPGGSAVLIIERMSVEEGGWGMQMQEASRLLAAAFAADRTYGDYLAMVFDPEIVKANPDTVSNGAFPPLLFVWMRDAVEQYSGCGIPPPGIYNDCSAAFTRAAEVTNLQLST